MQNQAGLVVTMCIVSMFIVQSQGFREEVPQKWSPEYFQYRFFPSQSTFKRRMPSYVQVPFIILGFYP